MKIISLALQQHYASSATTIATCWRAQRRDGKVFGYTSLDQDLTINGLLYSATIGVARTTIASSNDLSVQNLEVAGLLQQGLMALGAMTEDDILAGVWDGTKITIFEVNYAALSQGINLLQTGRTGEMKTGRLTYTTELRGLMQLLAQNIGRQTAFGCWKDVGSPECGVDMTPFTFTGSVGSAVANNRRWIDTSLGQTDHFFQYGRLVWKTGENADYGLTMEVKDSAAAGDIELQSEMFYPIAVGDTYVVQAGCNKLLKTADYVYLPALDGAITSGIDGQNTFSASSFGQVDGTFDAARLTWTTGDNTLVVSTVASFAGGKFTLVGSLPYPMQVGDSFTLEQKVTSGNVLYLGDCKIKFHNGINYGGTPELPGNDKVLGAGNQ